MSHALSRATLLLAIATIGLAPARPARAAGERATTFILSVDRLFGLSSTKATTRLTNTAEVAVSHTDLALLGGGQANAGPASVVHNTPRVALDVALGSGLTVGGAVTFTSTSFSTTNANGSESSGTDATTLVFAPRAGFVLELGAKASLWLRGGVTYFQGSGAGSAATKVTVTGLSLDLEPTLILMPTTALGVTVGAVADLPLTGTVKNTLGAFSTENDHRIRCLGLMVGALSRF